MLERLEIHNYALIEDSCIDFKEGFTVITGETGAGKSILLGALSLLLGEKAEVQSIRSGCESASVSASFFIPDPLPLFLASYLDRENIALEDGSLLISRVLKINGRSSTTIQGRLATRSDLASITQELLDISAQRDHQSLLSSANQLAVLDVFGSCKKYKQEYQEQYMLYQELYRRLEEKKQLLQNSTREAEFLQYAVDEIKKVDPKVDEDEQIQQQVQVISSYEQIYEALSLSVQMLSSLDHGGSSVLSNLHTSKNQLSLAAKADPSLESYLDRLESTTIEIEDIYQSLRDYLGGMNYSQEELDNLQGRLSQLQRLKKKYGPSLQAVLRFFEQSQQTLSLSIDGEIEISKLEKQLKIEKEELFKRAQILSEKRKSAAQKLSKEVEEKLRTLGMSQALFSISFSETDIRSEGIDAVSYDICANPGLPMRSIKDVASGGELSRIMLAVKTSLKQSDTVGTLLYDEVDAGIGGSVALSVAQQLSALSKTHQVIVITHLASIASMADHQFMVSKEVRENMSYSYIKEIFGDQRQKEIARMLSGESSSTESLEHAKRLLSRRD
jgi:DNA repair protein RecN (Recombination protein N)